jgi:acyl carrier protein
MCPASEQPIAERLRALMLEHLHVEVPSADIDLLDSGLLDSLQLVDLLLLIEEHFGRRISIEAIDLEDLRTLTRLARLLGTPAATTPSTRAGRAKADPEPPHGSQATPRRDSSSCD